MAFSQKLQQYAKSVVNAAIALTLLLGVLLRIILFLQNRNLIIDEANIVRNLAERGFAELAQPLSHEQYAPPVFLWIEKLISILFGYGESALRAFPLLCGIAALLVFYRIGVRFISKTALLIPVALFAFGPIYVRYSTELKQYMPDTLIALLLIRAAISWDTDKMPKRKFLLYWALAGSLAIWSSMPSVFILAGVGVYYAWPFFKKRNFKGFLPLLIVGSIWIIQFTFYYSIILKKQIGSEYLQNYHRPFFINALTTNAVEWKQNGLLLLDVLGNAAGHSKLSLFLSSFFVLSGMIILLLKRERAFFLIALPVLIVLLAAALHQFSLIERVVLFMMPLLLFLIGYAIDEAIRKKLTVPVLLAGIYLIWTNKSFWIVRKPWKFHEITEGMKWVETEGGSGARLFIHDASVPTYIYYTELHPRKQDFTSLQGAKQLDWRESYMQLGSTITDTTFFLYTGGLSSGELERRKAELEVNLQQIDSFDKEHCLVFVYTPKADKGISSGTTPN